MAMASPSAVPAIERGQTIKGVLYRGTKRARTRADLQRALVPAVAGFIEATCRWDADAALSDHRFVVFSIDITPEVHVYIQFWSAPGEPVTWEVSSGRWNPPADKWLAGERSQRIAGFGFGIGGEAENFHKEVEISSRDEAIRVARTVVDICYDAFEFRGLQDVNAQLVFESRATPELTYEGFTVDELQTIFEACGYKAAVVSDEDDEPEIYASRRGIRTRVVCTEPVDDDDVFRRALLTSDVEPPAADVAAVRKAAAPLLRRADHTTMTLGTTLTFGGGVTVGWVMERLREWDEMTRQARRQNAPKRRRKAR
jgi:hypothetical protein